MNPDHDLIMSIGRLEGKLDGFLHSQSQQGKRIDALDDRLGAVETDLTTIKATKQQGLNWLNIAISVAGVAVAAAALFIGMT